MFAVTVRYRLPLERLAAWKSVTDRLERLRNEYGIARMHRLWREEEHRMVRAMEIVIYPSEGAERRFQEKMKEDIRWQVLMEEMEAVIPSAERVVEYWEV